MHGETWLLREYVGRQIELKSSLPCSVHGGEPKRGQPVYLFGGKWTIAGEGSFGVPWLKKNTQKDIN